VSGQARFKNGVKISERHGAGEWTLEKVCLAILMPLGVWAVWSAFTLAGAGYGTVTAWFADRVNAGLMALTSLVFFTFASLAWKVIIEDYIHKPGTRGLLVGLLNLVFFVLAAASLFFIVRLALGSAPLPAGFGA
jgi:succinate dehydrogenase / fumarate reductase membrane anchor subunit